MNELDLTPRAPTVSSSKQRRARAKAVKTRLWSSAQPCNVMPHPYWSVLPQSSEAYPNQYTSFGVPMTSPPGLGSNCEGTLDQCADSGVEECHERLARLEERLTKLDQKLVAATHEAMAEAITLASAKLLKACNDRFTAIEVDVSNANETLKSMEAGERPKVDERFSAIEADLVVSKQRIEHLGTTFSERFGVIERDLGVAKETMKFFESVADKGMDERMAAVESDLSTARRQVAYLETFLGDSADQSANRDWHTGERIYLHGMKSADREDKCGVIHSDPPAQSDRVAVLLDDEDAPIRVPRNSVRTMPVKLFLQNMDYKIDCLGKVVWDEMRTMSKKT